MKKLLIILGAVLPSIIYSQTVLDSLLSENNRLKMEINDLKNSPKKEVQSNFYMWNLPEITLNNISFRIAKVLGKKETGEIDILMLVVAQQKNEELLIKNIFATDLDNISEADSKQVTVKGTTETEILDLQNQNTIKLSIHLDKFPSDTQWIKTLQIIAEIENADKRKTLKLEFKNLQIRWN